MNLDYENIILISHEDASKDITKRGGDKITAIKPNLQEKAANKVAGMVDMVARIIADDNKRTLSFKSDEVVLKTQEKPKEEKKEEVKEETPKRTTRKRTRNEEMSTDEMIDNVPFAPDEEVEEKMNEITMANGTPTTIEDALAMPTEKEVKEQLEEKKEEAPKATRTRRGE